MGDEGGKAFPGGALVCGPAGDVRVRGPLWEEALVSAPLDLADLTRARADMPLLADLRGALPHLVTALDRITRGAAAPAAYDGPAAGARAPSRSKAAKTRRRGPG